MKQNKKSFWDYIGISCYKYAPESFKAYAVLSFSNGNKNIPKYTTICLTYEESKICGNAFCCGGRGAALSELKKIMRKRFKEGKKYATVGFLDQENPRQYHFTHGLTMVKSDLNSMLRAYKEFKRDIIERGCKVEYYTTATLDGEYKVKDKETKYNYIDLTRPVIINFKTPKNYILA